MATKKDRTGSKSLMESLEPRILFDGVMGAGPDLVELGMQSDCPTAFEQTVELSPAIENQQQESRKELVIVDGNVADVDQLVASILSESSGTIEIEFLTQAENGITQIGEILDRSEQRYDAVHIFSHGDAGQILLGDGWIGVEDLVQQKSSLQGWADRFNLDADLLFYGCDLAESETGEQFLSTIRELTGTDVAASNDVTGAALLGGDWDLEVQLGSVETSGFELTRYDQALGPGEILGNVFDVTTQQVVGVEGVTVRVFDDDNNVVGSAVTDSDGGYLFSGLNDGQRYRIEFSNPPIGFESAVIDASSDGGIVFAEAGGANIDFNLHRPADFCDANPQLAVACFIQGTHDGQATDFAAIVGVEHNFTESSDKTVLATIGQVGSTYGIAHQSDTDVLFSSAFLKRNSGFGPEGMDAIYLIDSVDGGYANSGDANIPVAIKLSDFGIDVGTELSSDDRGLSDDPLAVVLDEWGWNNQFRLGIGDIDISDDGNTLYVMNLNDHDGNGTHGQLVILDVSDLSNVSLKGTVDIPNLLPGVVDEDLRAFATAFEDGNLYIGVTGTAESTQQRDDLKAGVYQLNDSETGFSLVAIDSQHVFGDTSGPTDHIPLNYERGIAYQLEDDSHSANFQPWTNDSSLYDTSGGFLSRPQALLTDIEFDDDGSMVLGFANRDAYQLGEFDIYPGGGNDSRPGLIAGEILRVERTDTGFELEGSTAAPSNASGPDNLGPNGGEYYFRDNFFSLHQETAMGTLALLPGSGQVVTTIVDPIGVNSGGLARFNNLTGGDRANVELYNLDDPGSAAKGAGLGDLELICHSAPVEIGNYIWFDSDNDGIQDAGENALAGVLVGLYDDQGSLVATVETDANGRYLFSSAEGTDINQDGDLLAEFAYGLDICAENCTYTVGVFDSNFIAGGALEGFSVTVSNASGTANDWTDQSDSDAVTVSAGSGTAFSTNGLTITTNGAGTNNHTFDFGFFNASIPQNNSPTGVTPTGVDPVSPIAPTPLVPLVTPDSITPLSIVLPSLIDGRPISGGIPIQLVSYMEGFGEDGDCCETECCETAIQDDGWDNGLVQPLQPDAIADDSELFNDDSVVDPAQPERTIDQFEMLEEIEGDLDSQPDTEVDPELLKADPELETLPDPVETEKSEVGSNGRSILDDEQQSNDLKTTDQDPLPKERSILEKLKPTDPSDRDLNLPMPPVEQQGKLKSHIPADSIQFKMPLGQKTRTMSPAMIDLINGNEPSYHLPKARNQ